MQQQFSSHNATFGSTHAAIPKELVDKERQRTKTKYLGTMRNAIVNRTLTEMSTRGVSSGVKAADV
jgi:hypothetical protein